MPDHQIDVRDLRKYARQTNIQLFIGALFVLFIIGDGLIYIIYGPNAAITGLICLAAAFMPVFIIMSVLWFMEWIVKRANRE